MLNLKRFLLVLVLLSLVCSVSFSEVVLTDEEAQIVFQALSDSEKFTSEFLIQSNLWLNQLDKVGILLAESEQERLLQDRLWKEQLKEASQKSTRNIIVASVLALALGVGLGVAIAN